MQKYGDFICLSSLLLFTGFMRWWALPDTPFWVDEFSTAHQADLVRTHGLQIFKEAGIFIEFHKFMPTLLTAFSFEVMGKSELSARIPFLIIGTLIPAALYILIRQWWGRVPALSAGLFAVFSYIMITWSRQARGYVLLQLIVILLFYSYTLIIQTGKKYAIVIFLLLTLIGIVTHPLFLIALTAIAIHALIMYRKNARRLLFIFAAGLGCAVLIAFTYINTHHVDIRTQLATVQLVNNASYYHSYLWRTQTLMTFLGTAGILIAVYQRKQYAFFLVLYLCLHLLFICFFFGPVVIRYTLPILPLLFAGAGLTLSTMIQQLFTSRSHTFQSIIIIGVTLIIIGNGDTFSPKPKSFYSVNHEFREIALINYPEIYDIIKKKGELSARKTAIIDTWPDRTQWYLGHEYPHIMLFRWIDAGLMKNTLYITKKDGVKVVAGRTDIRFVPELPDLRRVMQEYPRGFLIIDDTSLPQTVQTFAQTQLKKELTLDHFSLDDNPYSLWPVTLYSWGVQ